MTRPRLILVTLGRLTFEADLGARLAAEATARLAARDDRITDRLVDRLLAAISRPPQISANQRDQEP